MSANATTLRDRVARDLPGWRIEGEELVGRWRFPDFAAALAAAVRVGALAERTDHHPELSLGWGRLSVRLTTHSANALTEKDVDLATKIHLVLQPPNG